MSTVTTGPRLIPFIPEGFDDAVKPRPLVHVPGDDWRTGTDRYDTEDPYVYTDPKLVFDDPSGGLRFDGEGDPLPLQGSEAYIRDSYHAHPTRPPFTPKFEIWIAGPDGSEGAEAALAKDHECAVRVARALNGAVGVTPVRPSRRGALLAELRRLNAERLGVELHIGLIEAELAPEVVA